MEFLIRCPMTQHLAVIQNHRMDSGAIPAFDRHSVPLVVLSPVFIYTGSAGASSVGTIEIMNSPSVLLRGTQPQSASIQPENGGLYARYSRSKRQHRTRSSEDSSSPQPESSRRRQKCDSSATTRGQ